MSAMALYGHLWGFSESIARARMKSDLIGYGFAVVIAAIAHARAREGRQKRTHPGPANPQAEGTMIPL